MREAKKFRLGPTRTGLSILAIVAIVAAASFSNGAARFIIGAAHAQDSSTDSHDGGGKGKGSGGKGGHDEDSSHDDSSHDDSGEEGGKKGPHYQGGKDGTDGHGQGQGQGQGQGKGQGGPGADSEGKGPRAGSAGSNRSGKPAWAQEGIPEVELGRLNVARSPRQVLDRAYAEALASLSPEMASFYNMSLQDMVMALSTNFEAQSYIDSPLQNLSLLRDALDGTISLPGVTNNRETLMAVFLGVASDKTIPISQDSVIAVTTILGAPITGTAAQSLATDAESVRLAVLAGHG